MEKTAQAAFSPHSQSLWDFFQGIGCSFFVTFIFIYQTAREQAEKERGGHIHQWRRVLSNVREEWVVVMAYHLLDGGT